MRVSHRIYTHGADVPGFAGGHAKDLGTLAGDETIPTYVRTAVDETLKLVAPLENNGIAWVARRFGSHEGETFVALIVSRGDVVKDGKGRGGLINHAQILRVPSDGDWFDLEALINLAARPIDFVAESDDPKGRLDAYINGLTTEVALAAWTRNLRPQEEFDSLCEVASAMVSTTTHAKSLSVDINGGQTDVLRFLSVAWCALPKGVQINGPWALDAKRAVPNTIFFCHHGGSAIVVQPKVREVVQGYMELRMAADSRVRRISSSSLITTYGLLRDAFEHIGDENAYSASRSISASPRDPQLITSHDAPEATIPPPARVESTPMDFARFLNEQLVLIENRLMKYLDDRANLQDRAAKYKELSRSEGNHEPSPRSKTIRRWRWWLSPDDRRSLALFLPLILAVYFLGRQQAEVITVEKPDARIEKLTTMVNGLSAKVAAQASQQKRDMTLCPTQPLTLTEITEPRDWRFKFQWIAENKPLALVSLIQEAESHSLTPAATKAKLSMFIEECKLIGVKGDGNQANRIELRDILFAYVARTQCKPQLVASLVIDENVTINESIAADLKGVSPSLETQFDPSTSDVFMAEVVVRRIAK
jgi:hypothetical protein